MRKCVVIEAVVIFFLLPSTAWSQLPPDYCTQWGGQGAGPGQFDFPYGIAVDDSGNVYVADSGNRRIQVFTSNGQYITQWGSYGTGQGQFQWPWGIVAGAGGNIYVVEHSRDPFLINYRIQVFTSSGQYITEWGSLGTGPGQFFYPHDIVLDAHGNVYVTDTDNCRIQKFGYGPTAVQSTSWGRIKATFR